MTIQLRDAGAKGRGVFALVPFEPGQRIEEAPALVIPAGQREHVNRTDLADYPYDWSDQAEALLMGLGSFYNHSYQPNARYVKNFDRRSIEFFALCAIAPDDEITINYNGRPDDPAPLWFQVVEPQR